jgi:predicted branched-subunit amino acid permease
MKMKNGINHISLWFSILMVTLVFAGAIAFIFTDFMIDRVYGSKRTIMIVVFFAYSIFRGFRIYQVLSTKNDD